MHCYRLLPLIFAAVGLVGCGDSPTAPEPPPPTDNANLAVFTNPRTGFQTADVRDVNGEVVRFDVSNDTMIWTPDGSVFDGWPVDGRFLGEGNPYEVRFGTVDGDERAYFTERGPGTICDLSVVDGVLQILPTSRLPPNS